MVVLTRCAPANQPSATPLADWPKAEHLPGEVDMTRDQLQTAIREGIPFVIKMADGEKYEVSDCYRVALGKTTVIVVGEEDMPHVLPLLTMTGISYLKKK
jgi:hypothetical protein